MWYQRVPSLCCARHRMLHRMLHVTTACYKPGRQTACMTERSDKRLACRERPQAGRLRLRLGPWRAQDALGSRKLFRGRIGRCKPAPIPGERSPSGPRSLGKRLTPAPALAMLAVMGRPRRYGYAGAYHRLRSARPFLRLSRLESKLGRRLRPLPVGRPSKKTGPDMGGGNSK